MQTAMGRGVQKLLPETRLTTKFKVQVEVGVAEVLLPLPVPRETQEGKH